MKLCQEYLATRGITDDTVLMHGIEYDDVLSRRTLKDRLGRKRRLPRTIQEIVWFPRFNEKATIDGWIARLLPGDPSLPKFLCEIGSSGQPYIPKTVYKLRHGDPVIITEGPAKALVCVQAGIPAIGLNGVFGAGYQPDPKSKIVIRADLLGALDWRGRKTYIAFDADLAVNPDVRLATVRLFLLLSLTGSEIYQLTNWDISQGKGIDDYLVGQFQTNGQHPPADVIANLLANAKPFIQTLQKTPLDLGLVCSELTKVHLFDVLRSQLCRDLAKQLGVTVDDLRAVGAAKPTASSLPVYAVDPDPWPDPVNGEDLLHEISAVILRHVVVDRSYVVAAVLWIVLSYLAGYVDTLPLLVALSPTKRCGKSRFLAVLARLVRRPLSCVAITPATVYRAIEKWQSTLLVDEADNLFRDRKGNDNAELRTVFNSGFTRDNASVPRCVGDQMDVQPFSTWAPKVVALSGKLPDTIFDRSIAVKLRRRTKTEPIKPLRATPADEWLTLRRKILRFVADNADAIQNANPTLPKGLNDRAEDAWFPLLAIAKVAGGDWPTFAEKAAIELSGETDDQESVATLLLAAIKKIYQDASMTDPDDFLASSHIVQELNGDQEAPWSDWAKGKGITIHKLSSIVRQFGVKTEQHQINNVRTRGYVFKDLTPVFDHYL